MSPKNIRQFDELDLFIVFLFIQDRKQVSRSQIVNFFNIGEGSVKNILNILEDKLIIEKTSLGTMINKKFENKFLNLASYLNFPSKLKIDLFKENLDTFALVLNKYDNSRIQDIYKARDHAIRRGSQSAMILSVNNHIRIPNMNDYDFDYLFDEELNLKKGDLLITVCAKETRISFKGLFEICFYLNKDIKDFFLKYFN